MDTLARLEQGALKEVEQDHDAATFAPKVDRSSARIDWSRSAGAVSCHIRAMDEVPGGWSVLNGVPLKLYAPQVVVQDAGLGHSRRVGASPGEVLVADPRGGLVVAAGDGALRIGEVQPAGRRRMAAQAWLCGQGARAGDVLS